MTLRSSSILVTGAAGFIGSHVCDALLARGERVVGLDNFDHFYDEANKRRNVHEIEARADEREMFTFVEGDLCESEQMARLLSEERVSSIIHLAARAGVRPSIQQPSLYARVNVEGTTTLLEAARQTGCERFILASSSSVYGNQKKVPFCETDDVNEPISPYAASKRACELIAHTYHHLYELPIGCLRFFTVYGPRQRPDLAISRFIELIAHDRVVPMFGDGTTSRDYTYVDDIVQGVLAAHDRIEQHRFRIWNLGNNRPVALHEMIATIGRVVGKEPRVEQMPMQPGDVEQTYADLSRSSRELGYRPTVEFEDGVRRQWMWHAGAVLSQNMVEFD